MSNMSLSCTSIPSHQGTRASSFIGVGFYWKAYWVQKKSLKASLRRLSDIQTLASCRPNILSPFGTQSIGLQILRTQGLSPHAWALHFHPTASLIFLVVRCFGRDRPLCDLCSISNCRL